MAKGDAAAADNIDRRKTVAIAAGATRTAPTTLVIRDFHAARELLRSDKVHQAGAGASLVDLSRPEEVSLFYIDGDAHRQRRGTIARYFTLKAIETRYLAVMERTADALMARMIGAGGGRLDRIAFRFAVAVAAEIIGLDHADLDGLSERIEAMIGDDEGKRPTKRGEDAAHVAFNARDVMPALAARRAERRDDVISRLIDGGASDDLIRTEVRGYAIAGMITTREFVVMAAWYLFERPDLLARFRDGDQGGQLAILDEIIRLEPIVGIVKRRVVADIDSPTLGHVPAGTRIAIDIRATNIDRAATGACPFAVDPDRRGVAGSGYMSFGDGAHRCPGAQLAMHEARIFLDRLMAVPGIRMVQAPRIDWFKAISSYELHDPRVVCDRPPREAP